MQNMTLDKIAKACEGTLVSGKIPFLGEVSQVVMDSRQIEKDGLFIASVGERVDGHDFINGVYEAGAACVVCEKAPKDAEKDYILVKDSFLALRQIGQYYREQLSATIVGITGSVGKTSTKEFVAAVLAQKYKVLKTEGNFNNEIGLPLTILKIRKEHEVAVLEMGINHFGEMDRLGAIAKPDLGIITNIGQCHLEFLGSREGILQAKTELLPHIKPDGKIILNGDDDLLRTIEPLENRELIFYGMADDNELYADEIEDRGLLGSVCQLHTKSGEFKAHIPLPGFHMIYNALAATAVGLELGLKLEEIARGLKEVKALGGRSNVIQLKNYIVLDDCYNANPVSMKAALDLLKLAPGRKVAILGDMGELGPNAPKLHWEIGTYSVENKTDILICIGTAAAQMAEGARMQVQTFGKLSTKIYYFETLNESLEQIHFLLEAGDTILVKASHFMNFDKLVKTLVGHLS